MRLLLLSNSRNSGGGWLDHAERELRDFFGPPGAKKGPLLFFPFAAVSMSFDAYTRMAQQRFSRMGYEILGAHRARSIRGVRGFLAGGGSTFRLLDEMQRRGWLAKVKRAVLRGVPYAGWSAGSNLACPTIRTTNDMPIVEPRDQRIAEFQRLNPGVPVLGLREGSLLRLEGKRLSLCLGPGARLFLKNRKIDYRAGKDLSFLL